jgi:hypothetical protein
MWFLIALIAVNVTPAERIAHGQQLLNELEYEQAADELTQAAVDPAATEEERIRANLLAGIAHRVIGRDVEARSNFRYVLLRSPGWQLGDDTPPKVRLFFETVRQELLAERAPPTQQDPPPTAAPPATTTPVADAPMAGATIAGGALTAAGALAVVVGAGGLLFAETALADPTRLGGDRTDLRNVGKWSAGGAVAGVVVAGAGAALFLVGGSP